MKVMLVVNIGEIQVLSTMASKVIISIKASYSTNNQ